MKNIQFFKIFTFLLFISLFAACGNEPKTEANEATESETTGQTDTGGKGGAADGQPSDDQMAGGQATEIDPSFLAMQEEQFTKILQGRWQSSGDAEYAIEIKGNKIWHIRSGKQASELTFEIDTNCSKAECKGGMGWCFIEKTKTGTQCNAILRVDQKYLQYKVLGTTDAVQSFQKID